MTTETLEENEVIEESTGKIVVIPSPDKVALYNPIEAGLAKLEEKYKDGPKDLTIPANYEECRLAIADMRGVRGKTEKLRKELKADALAYGRVVDSRAKGIIDKVLEVESPYATAKKDHDTAVEIAKREKALAEERRVDGIASRIAEIGNLVAAHVSSSSAIIEGLIPDLETSLTSCSIWAMEFREKAESTITETLAKLEELHSMKVQQEQFLIEKAKAEKEAAEKAEADRIQREREAEEERARIAKEREAMEKERAAMQAEREKLAAEQAERDRIAKAEQDEKDRVARAEQALKDQAAAEEKARMAAEIEALRKAQEQVAPPEPVLEKYSEYAKPEPSNQQTMPAPDLSSHADNYKAAGRAIKEITGNYEMSKAILNAIIAGEIPNVEYTA